MHNPTEEPAEGKTWLKATISEETPRRIEPTNLYDQHLSLTACREAVAYALKN